MSFRLRTSKAAEETLSELTACVHLPPNVLMRVAVGLSLRDPSPVSPCHSGNGLEFHRTTLTGDLDFAYKALITQHHGQSLSDEDYFPGFFLAHAERGLPLLMNEYRYAKNKEKFLMNLLQLEE